MAFPDWICFLKLASIASRSVGGDILDSNGLKDGKESYTRAIVRKLSLLRWIGGIFGKGEHEMLRICACCA